VRDLSATTTRVDGPVDAVTKHIGGALEFEDCVDVTVETVTLTCASGLSSGAAGLTVRNTITAANATTGTGTVRVKDSRFTVGQMQYGMLLVHVQYAFVERNELLAAMGQPTAFGVALANRSYRRLVERILVGGATATLPTASSSSSSSSSSSAQFSISPAARAAAARRTLAVVKASVVAPRASSASAAASALAAGSASAAASTVLSPRPPLSVPILQAPNTGIKVGSVSVSFNTPPQLKGVWQTYLDTTGPKEFASTADLLKFVKQSAVTLLTNPAVQQQFSGFRELVRQFERSQIAMARAAIVVGGQGVTNLSVVNNVIDGFLQGVVVGVSHKERAPPKLPADSVGTVVIRDNRIGIDVDPVLGHAAGRYAIYVGNVESLQIENNRATLTSPSTIALPNEGIHVFGYLGRKVIVRHNWLTGFGVGIHVTEVTAPRSYDTIQGPYPYLYLESLRQGPLWLVADNIVEKHGETPIYAPSCMQLDNTLV
jgi:hypothetical protein